MVGVVFRHKGMLYKLSLEPMTTLAEVLHTFCVDHGIDSSSLTLKHHRLGAVNMTCPFQLSGIENNAQLEVVPKAFSPSSSNHENKDAGSVTVALQVGSERYVQQAHPDTSLWQLLESYHNQEVIGNVTQLTDPPNDPNGVFMMPTVNVMRREFDSISKLNSTTLRLLGASRGSILLRMEHKRSNLTLKDVESELSQIAATQQQRKVALKLKAEEAQTDQAIALSAASSPTASADVISVNFAVRSSSSPQLSLADIRNSLNNLRMEIDEREFETVMVTLIAITSNLIKEPENIKFHAVKLKGPKMFERAGRFPSAVSYLNWIGFEPDRSAPADSGGVCIRPPFSSERVSKGLDMLQVMLDTHRQQMKQSKQDKMAESSVAVLPSFSHAKDADEKERQRQAELESKQASTPQSMFDHPVPSMDDPLSQNSVDVDADVDVKDSAGDASPSYDIRTVRLSLARGGFSALSDAEYRSLLVTLLKITQNLLKTPPNPLHRTLNLANPTFHEKIGKWSGCMEYLRFLGFRLVDSSSSTMALPENEQDARVQRSAVVLQRLIEDATTASIVIPDRMIKFFDCTPGKLDIRGNGGPSSSSSSSSSSVFAFAATPSSAAVAPSTVANDADVDMSVSDSSPSVSLVSAPPQSSSTSSSSSSPSPSPAPASRSVSVTVRSASNQSHDHDDEYDAEDRKLLMIALAKGAKKMEQLQKFTTREQRATKIPKYDRTLIRVQFESENVVLQAFFHPQETISSLFELVKGYLQEPIPKFKLLAPPVTFLKDESHGGSTFQEMGFVPAAVFLFKSDAYVQGRADFRVLKGSAYESVQPMVAEPLPEPINMEEVSAEAASVAAAAAAVAANAANAANAGGGSGTSGRSGGGGGARSDSKMSDGDVDALAEARVRARLNKSTSGRGGKNDIRKLTGNRSNRPPPSGSNQ